MASIKYAHVTAIYGAPDYADTVTRGYLVTDQDQKGRHLGYVAKVGNVWKCVRPDQFGTFLGFHKYRNELRGKYRTRQEAAAWLEYQAAEADMYAEAAAHQTTTTTTTTTNNN